MSEFSQPPFYRFNQDSLELVRWAHQVAPDARRVLDLCAGCGVVGIEYARGGHVEHVTFLELQHEFLEHLEQNLGLLPPSTRGEIVNRNFSDWEGGSGYDLILCNPPFYLEGHGQESTDLRRHLARSMPAANWKLLFLLAENALVSGGAAFFITRDEKPIRETVEAALKLTTLVSSLERFGKNVIVSLKKCPA